MVPILMSDGSLGRSELQFIALLFKYCTKPHGDIVGSRLVALCWILVLRDEIEFGYMDNMITITVLLGRRTQSSSSSGYRYQGWT